jgi:hypothetical protein
MHPLFHIVYAAHARATHHKLALDALRHLACADADLWQRVFLRHSALYLEGATAPDEEFKDFGNHVLHTRDGFWGGAPAKVASWYRHVVEALRLEDWATAVYCGGVLSHYFMDPLQPFHTAQLEAENNIHRAAELSIWRSYDALRAQGERDLAGMTVEPGDGPGWLVELVCRGAELANADYEKLIAHYDIRRGVVDPAAGLDPVGRRIVTRTMRFAHLGFARVLERAIAEAAVAAPVDGLGAAMLSALVRMPAAALARARAEARERHAVERMYDELMATGTVEVHLPEEERLVRRLHAEQVLARRVAPPVAAPVLPERPREPVVTRIDQAREARRRARGAGAEVVALRPAPVPAAGTAAGEAHAAGITRAPMLFLVPPAGAALEPAARTGTDRGARHGEARASRRPEPVSGPAAGPDAAQGDAPTPAEAHSGFRLTLDHGIAHAPSVGARTAKRLERQGIATVRDLVKADPAALAVRLDARGLGAQAISDLQDEALLACAVPGLTGAHAELLVGAGYRSANVIAAAEADRLCADILAFALTPAGQRILEDGGAPDIERIKGWLAAARGVQAA